MCMRPARRKKMKSTTKNACNMGKTRRGQFSLRQTQSFLFSFIKSQVSRRSTVGAQVLGRIELKREGERGEKVSSFPTVGRSPSMTHAEKEFISNSSSSSRKKSDTAWRQLVSWSVINCLETLAQRLNLSTGAHTGCTLCLFTLCLPLVLITSVQPVCQSFLIQSANTIDTCKSCWFSALHFLFSSSPVFSRLPPFRPPLNLLLSAANSKSRSSRLYNWQDSLDVKRTSIYKPPQIFLIGISLVSCSGLLSFFCKVIFTIIFCAVCFQNIVFISVPSCIWPQSSSFNLFFHN